MDSILVPYQPFRQPETNIGLSRRLFAGCGCNLEDTDGRDCVDAEKLKYFQPGSERLFEANAFGPQLYESAQGCFVPEGGKRQ